MQDVIRFFKLSSLANQLNFLLDWVRGLTMHTLHPQPFQSFLVFLVPWDAQQNNAATRLEVSVRKTKIPDNPRFGDNK